MPEREYEANLATVNIMAYYQYPSTYRWSYLLEYSNIIEGVDPDDKVLEAAEMCREVSSKSNSIHHPTTAATTTTYEGAVTGFKELGFALDTVTTYNLDSIKSSLDRCYPVHVSAGDASDSTNSTGHVFIVRGYWDVKIKDGGPYNEDLAVSLGINWGSMGGFGDGWYLVSLGDLDIDFIGLKPFIIGDNGPTESSKNWIRDIKLITNIRPK